MSRDFFYGYRMNCRFPSACFPLVLVFLRLEGFFGCKDIFSAEHWEEKLEAEVAVSIKYIFACPMQWFCEPT
jgi:hypothetical protein